MPSVDDESPDYLMIDDPRVHEVSGRRTFLRRLIGAAGGLSVMSLLAACGSTAPAVPGQATATAPSSAGGAAPVAATPAAAASTATGAAKRGGTLKVALNSDIIGVDPHGASAGVDR